jgi:hypothetical protein
VCNCVFSAAGFITLRSIVIAELMGVRHLMNALGLLFMFQGFASVVGSPMSGNNPNKLLLRLFLCLVTPVVETPPQHCAPLNATVSAFQMHVLFYPIP